ncbi:MAG: hypothetical protein RSA74_02305 [Chryseobacterium sp.]
MVDANPLMQEIAKRVCFPCGNVADAIEFSVSIMAPTAAQLPTAKGQERAIKFGAEWQESNLSKTIVKFAPHAKPTYTLTGKTLYLNPITGIQIVVDNAGGYFRIQNTKLSFERNSSKFL